MPEKTIRLQSRKIIDASSASAWDKLVFNDTYLEFQMQSQFYSREKKYTSFHELVTNIPAAGKLHFLVSAAATGYLKQLDGIVPDIRNIIGKLFLPFSNYHFEIINSDIKNKNAHGVAISFFSEPLVWHDTIDDNLLVSRAVTDKEVAGSEAVLTDMVRLQPSLTIYSLAINNL